MKDASGYVQDDQLISLIANGDTQSFTVFYERYKTPILNYINNLIESPSTSEDVLQEVFIAVWNGAGKFKFKSSVKTWLYRIAHNRSISYLRKNHNNHKNISIDILGGNDHLTDGSNPESSTITMLESQRIRLAINQLNPIHRSVIELSFVHQFSYHEISQILRIPIGTVKSRMSYAIKYITGHIKADLPLDQKNED